MISNVKKFFQLPFFSLSLLLMISLFCQAQDKRTDRLLDTFLRHQDRVMVTAHRGGHLQVTENSLKAFKAAITEGADVLELDVRASKDGKLVVMHDKNIDRTTNGKGNISDYTYEELQKFRLTFEGKETDQQIPTLEEALLSVKNQILVDLDFKVASEQAVRDCYALISQLQMENQVLFFTYDHRYAGPLLDLNPRVLVMPRAHNEKEVMEILTDKRIKVIHVDPSFYTNELMKKIKDAGVRIWANTLGDYDDLAIKNQGNFDAFFKDLPLVNMVQTNQPRLLKAYVKKTINN